MSQHTAAHLEAWLTPVSQLVEPVYPWVNGLHILSIALLGCVALLDLRLLGVFPATAVSQLALPTISLAAVGLAAKPRFESHEMTTDGNHRNTENGDHKKPEKGGQSTCRELGYRGKIRKKMV